MPGLKLVAELGGDGSGFDAMMRRANLAKDKFGQSFAGLKNVIAGAFTVGALTALSRKTIDYASHLRDVSDALSVNVEWFQKRANAAKLAGGSEDDLFKFLDTMNKTREAAFNKPGGEESQRLGRLGFSQGDIGNLNTMDFFDRIVKAYGDGANAQTAVDVEKVGGKSARNLLAAFSNGFEGDAAIISEDLINQLDDIGDQFTILGVLLMTKLAPALAWIAEKLSKLPNKVAEVGSYLGAQTAETVEARKRRMGTAQDQIAWAEKWAKSHPQDKDKTDKIIATNRGILDDPALYEPGGVAANDAAKTADDELKKLEAARAKARELRKRRERSGPGFTPLDLDPVKEKKARGPGLVTDSLVGVGNFLGRNPGLVNSVANQQLQVARSQLDVLNKISNKLDRPRNFDLTGGIQVPST